MFPVCFNGFYKEVYGIEDLYELIFVVLSCDLVSKVFRKFIFSQLLPNFFHNNVNNDFK